jgi:hypothetical protein
VSNYNDLVHNRRGVERIQRFNRVRKFKFWMYPIAKSDCWFVSSCEGEHIWYPAKGQEELVRNTWGIYVGIYSI